MRMIQAEVNIMLPITAVHLLDLVEQAVLCSVLVVIRGCYRIVHYIIFLQDKPPESSAISSLRIHPQFYR